MRNVQIISFLVLSLFVVIMAFVSIATYLVPDIFPVIAQLHLLIMIITMIVFIGYGFFWSRFVLTLYQQEERKSHHMFDIVKKFLSKDEHRVLQYLVDNGGRGTQADIARIDLMGAVKALRTVQKLEQKGIVDVQREGKMRKVVVHQDILEFFK